MHFCLDIGGTTTRGALFSTGGKILVRAGATGAALSLGAEHAAGIVREVWQQIKHTKGSETPPESEIGIIAGIAGATIPGEAAKLTEILSEFASLRIVSDGYGALVSATNGTPGTLISVGTGLTGMRLFENGDCIAGSGWGFPIGDQGSGAWLGLCAMQDLTKYIDGIAPIQLISPDFISQILALTGAARQDILHWQKNAKPKNYASLAPVVVNFARGGDEYCLSLMQRAAREITELAQTLLAQNATSHSDDPVTKPIWLSGGLSSPLLPYLRTCSAKLNWQISRSEPLSGLYLLAAGKAPVENVIPRAVV